MYEKMIDYIMSFDETKDIEQKYRDYLVAHGKVGTGAGMVQIINKCAGMMDEGQCYVEVGTHCGSTLIGASLGNSKWKFYGVDNFSGHNSSFDYGKFGSVRNRLDDALDRLAGDNVSYFEMDYMDFLRGRTEVNGQKAGVYFYDGRHDEIHQYQGMKYATEFLDDKCIVFVDDTAFNDRGACWGAINKVLEEDKRFKVLREWIPEHPHGDMWCGLVALSFER